jgi:hypothetical protein
MDVARRRTPYAEYLALEAESDVRHEFLDGEVDPTYRNLPD